MGYNFYKRLSSLRRQADEDLVGLIGFGRAFFLALIPLIIFSLLLGRLLPNTILQGRTADGKSLTQVYAGSSSGRSLTGQSQAESEELDSLDPDQILNRLDKQKEDRFSLQEDGSATEIGWHDATTEIVRERLTWLADSWFAAPGSVDAYLAYARAVVNAVVGKPDREQEGKRSVLDVGGWIDSIFKSIAGALLRVGFAIIGFWHLWIAASIIGYFGARPFIKPTKTTDFLGVCNRGTTPFYSGIYAPLLPNQSVSGTDLSCPGLACPKQLPDQQAKNHRLATLLKRFGALNETNIGLVAVIGAYAHFPSIVEEERSAEEAGDGNPEPEHLSLNSEEAFVPVTTTGIVANPGMPLEKSAALTVEAVLEAHRALTHYLKEREAHLKQPESDQGFANHLSIIQRLGQQVSPLAAILLESLTPARARALATLPIAAVATAALAIEAGKSLVFKQVTGGFTQISRYPHLQARAVLHSVVPYHKEYNGDMRMFVRQAIICARRHGDFGRAFLPTTMSMASRALRDWLEILYAPPEKRVEISHLVELDSHLEEIHNHFRIEFLNRLKHEQRSGSLIKRAEDLLWKGAPFKSVVLTPLRSLIEIALAAISTGRQKRISMLSEKTRHLQASLSISARLPGFKRQAIEAESEVENSGGVTLLLKSQAGGAELVEKWLIVRRVLTRFNWLSTRVGDDAVPIDGLLQGIIIHSLPGSRPEVCALDALVPLRQRRFRELCGEQWERAYYPASPLPTDIEIFLNHTEFKETLDVRRREEKEGRLMRTTITTAASA